ncbi:methionine--tRNA ligase subunit beta [Candidatus Pacearchaeota archaeon]|nr:methionine--tRNA ligase subunit beta [Candidatus Pacearchaeota archaeon]
MADKIGREDFAKLDLRVGEIKSVEAHPNADKLLVLKVDLGEGEERTIVAGLKKYYETDELIGKKAIFVANLESAKLRGIESNGMILAAVNEDHSEVKILMVDGDMEPGTRIS